MRFPRQAAARSRRTVHSAQLGSGSGFSQAERAVRGGDTQCGAVLRPAVSDNTQCEQTFLVRGAGKVKQDLPVAPQHLVITISIGPLSHRGEPSLDSRVRLSAQPHSAHCQLYINLVLASHL